MEQFVSDWRKERMSEALANTIMLEAILGVYKGRRDELMALASLHGLKSVSAFRAVMRNRVEDLQAVIDRLESNREERD